LFLRIYIFFLCYIPFAGYSQTLKVNVTGIRNPSGSIVLAFYNTVEGFEKEKPLFIKKTTKNGLANGLLSITYTDLKSGTYGIAILDDENNNDKMDYGWFLPKEGFGFSNYYHTGLTRPSFTKFSFVLSNDTKTVEIKVRYL
jgi:uncharacterized protein (DUF2141 family)